MANHSANLGTNHEVVMIEFMGHPYPPRRMGEGDGGRAMS